MEVIFTPRVNITARKNGSSKLMSSPPTAVEPWFCFQTSVKSIWQLGMENLVEWLVTPKTASGFWIKIS